VLDNLQDVEIDHPLYNRIIEEYKKYYAENEFLSQGHFINHPDDAIRQLCTNILTSPYELSDNWSKMHEVHIKDKSILIHKDIIKAISILKLKKVIKRKLELEQYGATLYREGDNDEEIKMVMEDIRKLQEFIGQLSLLTGVEVLPYHRARK
jgi:DNA primase